MANSNNKRILIVVEGKKTEPYILKKSKNNLLSLVDLDYEITVFANPIYELYDAYKKGEYDDLVSYLHYEKNLELPDDVLPKQAFSAIYLIFDFESQYQKYSDEKIKELLELFNNETENGKLYINYPMIESFYHLKSFPDYEYNDRKISTLNLTSESYKTLVNQEAKIAKNKITKKHLCYIIMQNYNKAKYITKSREKEINYQKVLDVELEMKKTKSEIFVLSTLPLLLIDYNYEFIMEVLKSNLDKDFCLE